MRRAQPRAPPFTLIELLDAVEGANVGQLGRILQRRLGVADHRLEVGPRLLLANLALGQGLQAIHEVVPLGHGDTQLLLDQLRPKLSAVRHLHSLRHAVHGDGQSVVADHPHRGRHSDGGQRAIAGRRQQQVIVDLVLPLQGGTQAAAGQCPELATALEHPGGLELITRVFGQITVELQHLFRLHHLVTLGDDRQRILGIGAVEHLLLRERVDASQVARAIGNETHRGFINVPVHASLLPPDL